MSGSLTRAGEAERRDRARAALEAQDGFRVTFRWGHLDRMPKCEHGRVEGFCECWERESAPPA